MKTSGTPKAVPASRRAWSSAASSCVGRLDHAHPPAAAPHRCLDDHRISRATRPASGHPGPGITGASLPESTGMPASRASFRAATLSPSRSSSSGRGPTNAMPGRGAGAGELGVFRQEAVAGMNRVDFLRLGQLDDRLDVQITADRLARLADLVGLVGLRAMGGEPVFVRIDRHGPDAELVRRAKNADRDLAAIGGHQLAKRVIANIRRDRERSSSRPRLRRDFPGCRSDRWSRGPSRRA